MLLAAPIVALLTAAPAPERPRAFWQAIVDSGYRVPEGERAYPLLVELSELLGSPDPVLRDDFGYGIAAQWILHQRLLAPDELRALAGAWSANLARGLDQPGGDLVLLRSFSALDLSLLAAHDLERPFLGPEGFARLLDAALDYLAAERDLRGWVEGVGWVHATAHTADLLRFLARSPHLDVDGQRRVLDGIARKAATPGEHVFVHGEDDRLADAVLAVIAREDFEPEGLEDLLFELAAAVRSGAPGMRLEPRLHAAHQNARGLLRALHLRLALAADRSPALADARDAALHTLRGL